MDSKQTAHSSVSVNDILVIITQVVTIFTAKAYYAAVYHLRGCATSTQHANNAFKKPQHTKQNRTRLRNET
jgi:hypothetical protein